MDGCRLTALRLPQIGPPGSSKTLAVTVVTQNAKGDQSKARSFYRTQKRLLSFHYQCSRRSTSTEIEAVFKRAEDKQQMTHGDTSCFVFMDEAGLPEEQRESLKVLHYYLEDHMSRPAKVGFVAITNHALDAAKSNRCAILLRAEPDHRELMQICIGGLGSEAEQRRLLAQIVVGLDERLPDVLDSLCLAYQDLMREERELAWFNTFFGLRDFMHVIRLLARLSSGSTISLGTIVHALERNMSGVEEADQLQLINFWRSRLGAGDKLRMAELRNPYTLLRESLSEQAQAERPISRYKLLIDTTADDSILRLLHARRDLDVSTDEHRGSIILKLSDFREDTSLQQVTLVSSVKTAAEKGEVVVLSHTEPVNESFYDLFNQHFQRQEDRHARALVSLTVSPGGIRMNITVGHVAVSSYHANIAVGSHSKLCRVHQSFQSVVHMRLSELRYAPAPFLHRFEKYRLSHRNLLDAHVAEYPSRFRSFVSKVLTKLHSLVECIESLSLYGYKAQQTLESLLLYLVSTLGNNFCNVLTPAIATSVTSAAAAELQADPEALALLQDGVQGIGEFVREAKHFLLSSNESGSAKSRLAVAITAQWLLQTSVSQLIQVCTPERLYKHRAVVPFEMLDTYFRCQEHFSLKRLLRGMVSTRTAQRMVVYTRTTASLLSLPAHGLESSEDESSASEMHLLEALICEPFSLELPDGENEIVTLADFALCPLSLLTTQEALLACLRSFRSAASSKRVLLFFIDMAETPTSRVNFVRSKVDELCSGMASNKSIGLIMHFPASNVYVLPCYDTTFCDQWQPVFLDSISEEASALGALDVSEWLKLGASNDYQSLVDVKAWDLMPALQSWLNTALTTAASRIEYARGSNGQSPGDFNPIQPVPVQARVKLLDALMLKKLRDPKDGVEKTIEEVLCKRYSMLWTDGDHLLIRDRVQSATQLLASGQLRVSLVEAITGEVREAFCNYLTLMICKMNEQLNLDLLDEISLSTLDPHVQGVFLRCLTLLPIPPIPELKLLTQPRRIVVTSPPPQASTMFPFFHLVSALFSQATREVFATAEGRSLSERHAAAAVEEKIKTSDSPLAEVVRWMAGIDITCELPEEVWKRYVAHFVSKLFCGSPIVEQRMMIAWLRNRCYSIDAKRPVIALHVAAHRNEEMIKGLAAMLRPLSVLMESMGATSSAMMEARMGDLGDAAATREVAASLHAAIVQEFYRQMDLAVASAQQDPQQAVKWANAFGMVELRDLVVDSRGSNIPESATSLLVMSVVHAAAKSVREGDDCASLRRFAQEAKHAINAQLRLESVWRITQRIYPDRTGLMHRILELWCSTAQFECSPLKPEVRSDVEFLLNTLVHEHQLSETLRTYVVESLLSNSRLVGTLCDYNIMERDADSSSSSAEVLEILESHLVQQLAASPIAESWECAYVPPWFTQEGAKLDRPVAHAYFTVVLKQLLTHRSGKLEDSIILYCSLKSQLDGMIGRAATTVSVRQARLRKLERKGPLRVPHLRAITLAACKLLVVLDLGSRLAATARHDRDPAEPLLDGPEAQLMSDAPSLQLQALVESHPDWGLELMNALASEVRSRETMIKFLRAHGRRLLPAVLSQWSEIPAAAEECIGRHAKLAFAFDPDNVLHAAYCSLATSMTDHDLLIAKVRALCSADAGVDRHRLDVIMMMFAAIYYERGKINNNAVMRALEALQNELKLSPSAMRVFRGFLQPETLIAVREPGMPSDTLHDLLKAPPAELHSREDRELQSCIIGMIALTLGSNEATTHLATHILQPDRLVNTFGVGSLYSQAIGSVHYDCGCELTFDGDSPANRPRREPLDRHTRYFVLWSSFAALGVSLVTQPESQHTMRRVLSLPGQGLRAGVLSFCKAPWHHLGVKLQLDAESQCQLVLRALEHHRERSFQSHRGYANVFHSIPAVQQYEHRIMESFHHARQHLPDYIALLRRREAASQLSSQLDDFSIEHPPLHVAVRPSVPPITPSVIFEDELELVVGRDPARTHELAMLLTFTRKCHNLRFLWVLPDLIEFYQFLHVQLEYILLEEKAKQLSIGALLESMATKRGNEGTRTRFSQNDARRITHLWLRVKMGFNQFVAENQAIGVGACATNQEAAAANAAAHAQAALEAVQATVGGDVHRVAEAATAAAAAAAGARAAEQQLTRISPLDDSHPLWRFLSTNEDELFDDGGVRFNGQVLTSDSLFLVIKRMVAMHNDLVLELFEHGLATAHDKKPIKPLELNTASVALGDVRPWDLHLGVDDSKSLAQQTAQMERHLKESLLHLDHAGSFAKLVQLHWQRQSRSFDFDAIRREVNGLYLDRLAMIEDPSAHLRRVFRFRRTSAGNEATSGDEALATAVRLQSDLARLQLALSASHTLGDEETNGMHILYFRMFHSLEHEQVAKLLRGLDMVATMWIRAVSAGARHEDATIRTQLGEMFPDVMSDAELLQRVHIELYEEEQCNTLLQVRFTQLSLLLNYLRTYLSSQDYIFARLPFVLKARWDDDVIVTLNTIERTYDTDRSNDRLPLSAAAAQLEAGIVDYEQVFSSEPETPLHRFMVNWAGSEQALYEELPLMRELPKRIALQHYVELRKLLHRWSHRPVTAAPIADKWAWPFLSNSQKVAKAAATTEPCQDIASRWVLWFEDSDDLIDANTAGQVREVLDEIISALASEDRHMKKLEMNAIRCQFRWRYVLGCRKRRAEKAVAQAALEAAHSAFEQLRGATDKELPSAIAAARPHASAFAELAELLLQKQARMAEIKRNLSEARMKTMRLYVHAVGFLILAMVIPLLVSSLVSSGDAALDLTSQPELASATQQGIFTARLTASDEFQLDSVIEGFDDGAKIGDMASWQMNHDLDAEDSGPPLATPEVEGPTTQLAAPTAQSMLQQTDATSLLLIFGLIVGQGCAWWFAWNKWYNERHGDATKSMLRQLTSVALILLLILGAWWSASSMVRWDDSKSVHDRLSHLVSLREAGLVTEQNYLERERELLQMI